MAQISLVLDGKKVEIEKGKTILEAAQRNGIDIPTLCHDPRLKPTAACRLCLVQVEKARGLLPACATMAGDGMVVTTTSPELAETRRIALELMLSDHYGDCVSPCKLACPAGIDIQGFIAHIANGQYLEALKLIKESNPLPLVCGRVCPRFCEAKCRRNLLEGAVAINALKRFAADCDAASGEPYVPEVKPFTGNRVAVIGGGPAGLTAAYYLAIEGHRVTIFDSNPKLGGMLRYGIPEYRLPKAILDNEIAGIIKLCHEAHSNVKLGEHFTIKELKESGFDAIFLALGAQADQRMKIDGENLKGVFSGIGFLRDVTLGTSISPGKRVAVVGGGNTAIDAARTALRLGAEQVTIVYRRSREEMPANDEEVKGAEEEGVQFQFLASPIRLVAKDGEPGTVGAISCVRMALGAPDASGRRKPEPVTGSEFNTDVDSVIMAVGQTMDASGLGESGLQLNRKNFININETMSSSEEGVFAGGDCTSGPATAVEAIAAGHRAALAISKYLKGENVVPPEKLFNCTKGELKDIDKKDLAGIEPAQRAVMPALKPEERRTSFREIDLGLTEEAAKAEAGRCLSCGCQDVFDCKLRKLATEYKVVDGSYAGRKKHLPINVDEHPYILRDQNKCILCGRCVRICTEVAGISALGFTKRGVATSVEPSLGLPLCETSCNSCGLCVSTCPTGALTAKVPLAKPGPWKLGFVSTLCTGCGIGCNLEVFTIGGKIVKITSPANSAVNNGSLCARGFLSQSSATDAKRLNVPLVKKDGKLVPAGWEEALVFASGGLKQIKERGGSHSIAVLASAQCTNEESYLLQKLARLALGTNNLTCLSAPRINTSLKGGLGKDASTCTYDDILSSDLIIVYDCDMGEDYPVIELKVREAVGKGSKLVVLNPRQTRLDTMAKINFRVNHRTGKEVLHAMLGYIMSYDLFDRKFVDCHTSGFTDFAKAVKDYPLEKILDVPWMNPAKIIETTHLYLRARKPVIIVDADSIMPAESDLILDLALVTGNVGRESSGIMVLRSGANTQGLFDMGVTPDYLPGQEPLTSSEAKQRLEEKWQAVLPVQKGKDGAGLIQSIESGEIHGLLVVGRKALGGMGNSLLQMPIFSVLIDTAVPERPPFPDVVLPGSGMFETEGTYINCENRLQRLEKILAPPSGKQTWEVIAELAAHLGYPMPYRTESEINEEIMDVVRKGDTTQSAKFVRLNRANGHSKYRFGLPARETVNPQVNLEIV